MFDPQRIKEAKQRYFSALIVHESIYLKQGQYRLHFKAAPKLDDKKNTLALDKLYLNQDLHDKQFHFAPQKIAYQLIKGDFLLSLPMVPPHLGAYFDAYEAYPTLERQLAWLKAQNPKAHYRFLILASDGGLGDTLMKATAYEQLFEVLGAHLPDFSVDFSGMTISSPLKSDQFYRFPQRGQILKEPVTVQKLLEYDAIFNMTGALTLELKEKNSFLDQMLLWLGLEPKAISAQEKRNRIVISRAAWREVATWLSALPDTKRKIVFNHKASCELRSFPKQAAVRFIRDLVAQYPDIHVIVPQALPVQHERVTVYNNLPTYHHLSALIGQADGLITVDSFAQHAADALNVPTVTLSSSIDIAQDYPYYPYLRNIMLPNAEQLPLYGQAVEIGKNWVQHEKAYQAAWAQIQPEQVMDALVSIVPAQEEARIIWREEAPPPRGLLVQNAQGLWQQRAQPRPTWLEKAERYLGQWIEACVLANSVYAWVAPGDSPMPLQMAQFLGSGGHLHLYEPRTLFQKLQRFNLDQLAATPFNLDDHLPTDKVIKGAPHVVSRTQATDTWGNLPGELAVKHAPWMWAGQLHGMIIYPPADPSVFVESFMPVVKQGKVDVILVGQHRKALYPAARKLQALGYKLSVPPEADVGLIIARPKQVKTPHQWHTFFINTAKRAETRNTSTYA